MREMVILTSKQREKMEPLKMRKSDLDRKANQNRRKKNGLVLANDPDHVLANVRKDLVHGGEVGVEIGREKVARDQEIVKDPVQEIIKRRARRTVEVAIGTRRRKLQETTTRRKLDTSRVERSRKRSWNPSTWRSLTRLRLRDYASFTGRISLFPSKTILFRDFFYKLNLLIISYDIVLVGPRRPCQRHQEDLEKNLETRAHRRLQDRGDFVLKRFS